MNIPIWTQAARLAAQTPPERNRYVDFLRAASICVVILGHWLVVAIYTERTVNWWPPTRSPSSPGPSG